MKIFKLITIIMLTFLPCLLGENKTESELPTGDIMVAAECCFLRPYEFGLRLELNKLPDPSTGEYPPDLFERKDWYEYLKDSIGDSADLVKYYLFDSLNVIKALNGNFKGLPFRKAVTDSLGRYIFHDVPIGRYQLICYERKEFDPEKELSDSLYSERTDFPIEPYSDIIQGLIDTLGIDSAKIALSTGFRDDKSPLNNRSSYRTTRSSCGAGIMNGIRVAPDSTAEVRMDCKVYTEQSPIGQLQFDKWKENYRRKEK
ncbi:MAG: hypothetical protein GF404_04650 [candidate division Zixibacteria bacterium]|nr:hypothetical protein [candidate division Zixibacteria bacterium]